MKYFFLSIILLLSSCSLDKNSTYWNKDSETQSIKDKKLSKILKKTGDYKSMTFDECSSSKSIVISSIGSSFFPLSSF